MSEEEIIERAENIIQNGINIFNSAEILNMRDTVQGLLDLYNQEKEKNKELHEKLKISIAMLTKGTYPETEKGANDFDKYYISKDKIRKFIKDELPDNEICECCNNYDINGVYIKEKLEKLLEK